MLTGSTLKNIGGYPHSETRTMLDGGQKSGERTISTCIVSMEILRTPNIKSRIFNAAKFIQRFGIPLR
jgi:hypothetical protein